ncbi:MAG: helix-turn-helix domain-containing protein [Pseudomonadota bacterium]|nr:helix-turn-helix domain-containing protein [Pseudomonadota bacterium]
MPSSPTPASKKPATPGKRATRASPVRKAADIVAPKPRFVTPASEIDGLTGDPNFMTSLARGLAVIRAFTQQRRHLTIAQLSHRTGIPRAAVRRCLYTLAKLGYVAADEARGYSLRPGILALGHAYLSSTPLATMVQPLLDHVSDALHESSSMAVLEGDEILYIARSTTTTRLMSIDLGIGSRLPAYCSSMGRVLLASLSAAELDGYLSRVKLTRLTNRTIVSASELKRALDGVRSDGFSVVDQELEIGLRSIAVPVIDPSGKVVASINVGTQSARVSVSEMETKFLPALQFAARELGTLLPR